MKFTINIILQVGIKFFAIILGFITTRILIDQLPVEDYTTYNLIISYTGIIIIALNFGLPNVIFKFYTNRKGDSEFKDFWTTVSVIRILTYFIGLIIIALTHQLSQRNELLIAMGIYSAQFILLADLSYRSVCDAFGRSWQFSLTDFIGKIIVVAGLLIASQYADSLQFLYYVIIVLIFAYSISYIIDAIWQYKFTGLGSFQLPILRDQFGPIIYLSISLIAVAIFFNTDKIFLAYFGFEDEVVSGYANAYRFFELAYVFPGLTIPVIASFAKKRFDALQTSTYLTKFVPIRIYNKFSLKTLIYFEWISVAVIIGLFCTLGLYIFGPIAVRLIDTELKYPIALEVIPILSLAFIPQTAAHMTSLFLIVTNGEKFDMTSSIIVAIVGIICYVLFIPRYSFYGAAFSTIFLFSLDFTIKLIFLVRTYLNQVDRV